MFICWNLSLKVTPDWVVEKYVGFKIKVRLYTITFTSHSEAICAYQGNKVERAIINNSWEKYLEYVMTYVRDASIFQFVTKHF